MNCSVELYNAVLTCRQVCCIPYKGIDVYRAPWLLCSKCVGLYFCESMLGVYVCDRPVENTPSDDFSFGLCYLVIS